MERYNPKAAARSKFQSSPKPKSTEEEAQEAAEAEEEVEEEQDEDEVEAEEKEEAEEEFEVKAEEEKEAEEEREAEAEEEEEEGLKEGLQEEEKWQEKEGQEEKQEDKDNSVSILKLDPEFKFRARCAGVVGIEPIFREHLGAVAIEPNSREHSGAVTIEPNFGEHLDALGLRIVNIKADGNCMFRALAEQLVGDEELHEEYRRMVVEYMIEHHEDFQHFIEAEGAVRFRKYCQEMSQDKTWGGHLELQAASMVSRKNIRIHRFVEGQVKLADIKNFDDAETLLLSYHYGSHYNGLRLKSDDEVAKKIAKDKGKGKMFDSEVPSAGASGLEKYDEDFALDFITGASGSPAGKKKFISGATGFTNVDDKVKYISGATGLKDPAEIQNVLREVDGDPYAAVDFIYEEFAENPYYSSETEEEIVEFLPDTVETPDEDEFVNEVNFIADATRFTNPADIKDVLRQVKGDTSAAIDWILKERDANPHLGDDAGEIVEFLPDTEKAPDKVCSGKRKRNPGECKDGNEQDQDEFDNEESTGKRNCSESK